jgi:hypothetical protein
MTYPCPERAGPDREGTVVTRPTAEPGRPTASRGRRTARRAALLTTAAVLAALPLSGCAPQAGSAAVVDGRRISVGDVQDAYRDLLPLTSGQGESAQSAALRMMIMAPYLRDAGRSLGVMVSDDQIRRAVDKWAKDNHQRVHLGGSALTVLQASQMLQILGNSAQQGGPAAPAFQRMQQRLQKASLSVNPRYGHFDPATLEFTPAAENWLKTATPAPQGGLPGQGGTGQDGTGQDGTTPAP